MFKRTVPKEVPHVPRAPPQTTNRKVAFPSEPSIVLPLDQLWNRLPSDLRQEVLQRLTLMMVQQLVPPDDPGEASHE